MHRNISDHIHLSDIAGSRGLTTPTALALYILHVRGLAVNVNRAPFSSRNTALAHSAWHDLADLMVNLARFLRG